MRDSRQLSLVGIGFGPQGVAIAAAIEDMGEHLGVDFADQVTFFEKEPGPGWQTGLLFRNADIQHHYFRDLATPRDPRSRFTFANFLKEQDRIYEFGSLVYGGGGGAVSRIEWSEYVAWAATLLDDYVTYDSPVNDVRATSVDGEEMMSVTLPDGDRVTTRAVVYCGGRDLFYPSVFREHVSDSVFHATSFLERLPTLPDLNQQHVAVVGAGQSAIEIVQYLHNMFPRTRIACIQRAVGFHHGDHSPFVQRMFHAKESDYFFALPPDGRKNLLEEVMRANYAAVDKEAVSALYRTMYEDRLLGKQRIQMVPSSVVTRVQNEGGRYVLDARNSLDGSCLTVVADVVILATGYVAEPLPRVLDPLGPILRWNELGHPVVNYDFSLETIAGATPLVFVPSAGESSHGLASSSSFSMVALKAERVAGALVTKNVLSTTETPRSRPDGTYVVTQRESSMP